MLYVEDDKKIRNFKMTNFPKNVTFNEEKAKKKEEYEEIKQTFFVSCSYFLEKDSSRTWVDPNPTSNMCTYPTSSPFT
jgi:hypothetical protein